jgi:predicted  nucleic acid-binding Zn-ribbon protein
VVLDLESIRILKPGQYELDLVHLFRKQPLIYKLAEGKYLIDLPETFKEERDKKKR